MLEIIGRQSRIVRQLQFSPGRGQRKRLSTERKGKKEKRERKKKTKKKQKKNNDTSCTILLFLVHACTYKRKKRRRWIVDDSLRQTYSVYLQADSILLLSSFRSNFITTRVSTCPENVFSYIKDEFRSMKVNNFCRFFFLLPSLFSSFRSITIYRGVSRTKIKNRKKSTFCEKASSNKIRKLYSKGSHDFYIHHKILYTRLCTNSEINHRPYYAGYCLLYRIMDIPRSDVTTWFYASSFDHGVWIKYESRLNVKAGRGGKWMQIIHVWR